MTQRRSERSCGSQSAVSTNKRIFKNTEFWEMRRTSTNPTDRNNNSPRQFPAAPRQHWLWYASRWMSTCDRQLEADVNLPHKTRVLRASGNNRTEGQENSRRRAGPDANAIQPEASALGADVCTDVHAYVKETGAGNMKSMCRSWV